MTCWGIFITSLALVLFLLPPNANSFVPSRRRQDKRFGQEFGTIIRKHGGPHLEMPTMCTNKDDEDTGEVPISSNSEKKLNDEVDAFIIEQEANRRVNDRLMLPRRVATSFSQTVGALAWTFIISGIILNFFGYAYVKDDTYGYRIDTIERKMFQEEVVRSMRSERK